MGRKAATKATPEKEVNDLAKAVIIAALAAGSTVLLAAQEDGRELGLRSPYGRSDAAASVEA